MGGIYIEENGKYQIDLTKAFYSTEDLHKKYQTVYGILNDVDWIAETDEAVILIEFTHYAERQHLHEGDRAEGKHHQIARKFYGGAFYLLACGNSKKPIDFIWIVESPYLDSFVRKRYFSAIKKWLPFELQKSPEIEARLIRAFLVLSVEEWNERYSMFPITLRTEVKHEDN